MLRSWCCKMVNKMVKHIQEFFDNNRLIAVFPTNIRGSILYSHGGLTFGGVLSDRKMRTPMMIEVFAELKEYWEKFKEKYEKGIG